MFIIWKMPSTDKTSRWDIEVVYKDLVFLRSHSGIASALIDMATGEGMVVKPYRDHMALVRFHVSDSLNDLLFDRLDGVEVLGVPGAGVLEPSSDKESYH